MADEDTSIRIKLETWNRLNSRKDRPNKSFNDVIVELLDKVEEYEATEGNANSAAVTAG